MCCSILSCHCLISQKQKRLQRSKPCCDALPSEQNKFYDTVIFSHIPIQSFSLNVCQIQSWFSEINRSGIPKSCRHSNNKSWRVQIVTRNSFPSSKRRKKCKRQYKVRKSRASINLICIFKRVELIFLRPIYLPASNDHQKKRTT